MERKPTVPGGALRQTRSTLTTHHRQFHDPGQTPGFPLAPPTAGALGLQNFSAPYMDMEAGLEQVDMRPELPAQPVKA